MTPAPSVSAGNPPLTWDNGQSGTGRTPTSDPLLDRINLGIEGSGPMHIVPTAEFIASTPPDLYATRMATADGCGECVTNVETPSSVHDDGPGAFVANYVCLSCGHAWTTSWRD